MNQSEIQHSLLKKKDAERVSQVCPLSELSVKKSNTNRLHS